MKKFIITEEEKSRILGMHQEHGYNSLNESPSGVGFGPEMNGLKIQKSEQNEQDVEQINDPRFIGGHPMAGSELIGLAGADAKLFEGAVWVLTPSVGISDSNFEQVAGVVTELGSEIVVLDPQRHDQLVAIVSHLPHLTAAALMGLASSRSEEHVAVLRLAAGGFRDMTRVASGHPAIWIDICRENRDAIVIALDGLIDGLVQMKQIVEQGDSEELMKRLQQSRIARSNLPSRVRDLMDVVEVRVPIPDRSGAAAEIFTLAAELGVNIANFEVAHSVEGERGVLVLVVEQTSQDVFRGGLPLGQTRRPAHTSRTDPSHRSGFLRRLSNVKSDPNPRTIILYRGQFAPRTEPV